MDIHQADERKCKICLGGEDPNDAFRMPCKCSGSMRYIHAGCLEECMKRSQACEICGYRYRICKEYAPGTPSSVPIMLILRSFLGCVFSFFSQCACAIYILAWVFLVGMANLFGARLVLSKMGFDGWLPSVAGGVAFLAANYLHNYLFIAVYNSLGDERGARMNVRRALESMASTLVSRTDSDLGHSIGRTTSGFASLHEEEEDVEEGSSTASLVVDYDICSIFYDSTMVWPDWSKCTTDAIRACSHVWLSGFICLFSYFFSFWCSRIAPATDRLIHTVFHCAFKAFPVFLARADLFASTSALYPAYVSLSLLLGISMLVFIIFYLIQPGRISVCVRSCAKFYSIILLESLFSFLVFGTFAHFLLFTLISNSTPPQIQFNPCYSFIFHIAGGSAISKLANTLIEDFHSTFRRGLRYDPDPSSINTFIMHRIRRPIMITAAVWLWKTLVTCFSIAWLVFLIFCYSPPLVITDNLKPYLIIKLLLVCQKVAAELEEVAYFFVMYFIRAYSGLFDASNYLFNTPIAIKDPSRLFWDVNIDTCSRGLHREVKTINAVLDSYKQADEAQNKKRDIPFSPLGCNAGRGRAQNENGTISWEMSSGETVEGEWPSTARKIIRKYKITKERISKYFAKSHPGKFSIFYKPRLYWLFKLSLFAICFTITSLFCLFILKAGKEISSRILPGDGFFFVFSCVSFCRLLCFILRLRTETLASLPNTILIHLTTNLAWPILFAGLVLFMHESSEILYFSSFFVQALAFSGPAKLFIHKVVLGSTPLGAYGLWNLFRRLFFFTVLALILVFTVVFIYFFITIKIVLFAAGAICIGAGTVALVLSMACKDWLEEVRDKYYLEQTTVMDYTE